MITLSASPSKEIPISALFFFTAVCIFLGKVEPHFSFMFKPFGLFPIIITSAPKDLINFGAAL